MEFCCLGSALESKVSRRGRKRVTLTESLHQSPQVGPVTGGVVGVAQKNKHTQENQAQFLGEWEWELPRLKGKTVLVSDLIRIANFRIIAGR